jgi:hypothetical protein
MVGTFGRPMDVWVVVRRQIAIGLVLLLAMAGLACAAGGGLRAFRGPGIVLRYPRSWFVSTEPLNGIIDPVQRFVLSSYRVPVGRPDFGGNYVPPPRGVIAQLVEEVPPLNNGGVWPMRPHQFKLGRLGRMEGFGGNRWAELRFRDHGRRFYIFIGVGRNASSARIALLLRSLDGMRIAARR